MLRVDNFLTSLNYMWQGMLCIFIVIGVIILATMAMTKIFSKNSKKKEENQ